MINNQAEITKGWITEANSIEELAEKLNIDPAGLKATVEAYDAACASGNDAEFGRTEVLSPIGSGPFYGCEMGLGIINTQGGPARDAAHHVLDWDNKPIPRLYAAGEFGSIYVFLYQGAGNVSETLGGRVAGANAAVEQPWS
jgi:predicted oxidoreductase